jgi:peptide subunit release factor 1 (eRF1)
VDVSYGGENGFNQAIELSSDALSNIKFVQEKKLIQKYFDQINQDSGRFCFGVDDTMKALDMGACETLICWESLEVNRYVIKNDVTGEAEVFVLTPEKERDSKYFRNAETGVDKEVLDKQSLTEYFANEYKTFGKIWFFASMSMSVISFGACIVLFTFCFPIHLLQARLLSLSRIGVKKACSFARVSVVLGAFFATAWTSAP